MALTAIQPATAVALSLIPVIAPTGTTVGNTETYAMLAINQGPASTTGLTVAVTLPAGATFVTGGSSLGIAPRSRTALPRFSLETLPLARPSKSRSWSGLMRGYTGHLGRGLEHHAQLHAVGGRRGH